MTLSESISSEQEVLMMCKRLDLCGGFEKRGRKGKDPRRNPMISAYTWTISYYLWVDVNIFVILLLLFSVFTWL